MSRVILINDAYLYQINLILTVLYLLQAPSVLALWYVGGFFLLWVGIMGLSSGGSIFIGFLWVIDLGLGLITLLIILNLTTLLHDRTLVSSVRREYYLLTLSLIVISYVLPATNWLTSGNTTVASMEAWALLWIDFFDLWSMNEVSELALLRYMFFVYDSLPFILINFIILYGLVTALTFTFVAKRWTDTRLLLEHTRGAGSQIPGSLFIRQQDFATQQRAATSVRTWVKARTLL